MMTESPTVVGTYVYVDENAKPIGCTKRIEPGRNGRRKDFEQHRSDGAGGFTIGLAGKSLPLYRLPDVLAAAKGAMTILMTEGEGKCDALRSRVGRSAVVTTIAGGANAPLRDEHVAAFAGAKRVVVLADSDAPGRAAAALRAARIAEVHPLVDVRVLDLYPDRNDGSDVADWLADGKTPVELPQLIENAPRVGRPSTVEPRWDDLTPWPRLREEALYGIAGDVVRLIGPHTEADDAALLFTFLTCIGNMIGPGPHVRVGPIRHEARLSIVVVGASAKARKGQSFAEVGQLLSEADSTLREATAVSGLASGEGLIARLRDRDDAAPVEKRALIHEPEFARFLAAASREGSTLSAIVRDAWDGSTLRVLTRKDPLEAKGAFISFVGHITVDELHARLTDVEVANGFANRLLFVSARRSKLLPSGGSLRFEEVVAIGRRLRDTLERARRLGELPRSPEFAQAWAELYPTFSDEPGLAGAIIARAETQTLRLALIFATLDCSPNLEIEHLVAGYVAWRYCEDSARHIFGLKLGDDVRQRLLDEARAVYPDGLDRTAQRDLFNRHVSEARLATARQFLIERGFGVERDEPTDGRPRRVFFAKTRVERGDKSPGDPLLPLKARLQEKIASGEAAAKMVSNDDASDETVEAVSSTRALL